MILGWCTLAFATPLTEQALAAERVLQDMRAAHTAGRGSAELVYLWSVRLRDAAVASGDPTAATAHQQRMLALQTLVEEQVRAGTALQSDLDAARYFVLSATPPADRPAGPSPGPSPGPSGTSPGGTTKAGPTVEACFQQCDLEWNRCAAEAEHLRLGVGPAPTDAACSTSAESRCGAGRTQTAIECRDQDKRACVAAKATATCAKDQTLCSARCR
jgi:hypothetical protein